MLVGQPLVATSYIDSLIVSCVHSSIKSLQCVAMLFPPLPSSLGRLKTFRRELVVDDEEGAGLELETVTWMQGDWKKLESNESVNGAIAAYIVATRIRPRSMIFFFKRLVVGEILEGTHIRRRGLVRWNLPFGWI